MKKKAKNTATKKTTPQSYSYAGLRFHQRDKKHSTLVVFHAPVREVLEWATTEELTPTSAGAQRHERRAKIVAIRKFLAADPRNTIPTAVILAIGKSGAQFTEADNGTDGRGTLTVSPPLPAAAIVDGQHRLLGLKDFDPNTRIPIVALLNADAVEKAFQFLVINNKATRVPANHTKALIARMVKSDLANRLKLARMAFDAEGVKDVDLVNTDEESPFFQSIDWPTTPKPKRIVQATAIEVSLEYLAGQGVQYLEDRDVRRGVFLSMWTVIKSAWPDLWERGSKLLSKVGVICLTRFIVDLIVSWSDSDVIKIDISDPQDVEEYTEKILVYMNAEFWKSPWAETASGGFDTNQGRDRVYNALKQLYRNGKGNREWHDAIDIIDATSGRGE